MSKQKEKVCTCETPKLNQPLPEGFEGTIVCAECEGIATYPLPEDKYDGDDPIEEYLFNSEKRHVAMNNELALVIILLRIEKKLSALLPGKAKKK